MMKFGMIGLGKMGMNLVKNAVDHEIEVVAKYKSGRGS